MMMTTMMHSSCISTVLLLCSLLVLQIVSIESFAGASLTTRSTISSSSSRTQLALFGKGSSPSASASASATASATATATVERTVPSTGVLDIKSHADWLELLLPEDANSDRITLVLFKASWCRSCKAFGRDWKRKILPIAKSSNDRQEPSSMSVSSSSSSKPKGNKLRLATVDIGVGVNKKLCKDLKIRALPTVQFYHDGKLLTSFSCGPKRFQQLETAVDYYLNQVTPEELAMEANLEQKKQSIANEVASAIQQESSFSSSTSTSTSTTISTDMKTGVKA